MLAAVALTGTVFMGQAIMVKSSEHEKNLAWVSRWATTHLLKQCGLHR